MSEREYSDETVERVSRAYYEARTGKSWTYLDNFSRAIERSWTRRALRALAPLVA